MYMVTCYDYGVHDCSPLVVDAHELRLAGAPQLWLDVLAEEVGHVETSLSDLDVAEIDHLEPRK